MLLSDAIIKLNASHAVEGALTVSPALSNALLKTHGNTDVLVCIEETIAYLRVAGRTLNFDLSTDVHYSA